MRRLILLILRLFTIWFGLSSSALTSAASPGSSGRTASLSSVFALNPSDLANPTSRLTLDARQALQAHSVLTVVGSKEDVARLGQVLGIALPSVSVSQSVRVVQNSQSAQKPAAGAAGGALAPAAAPMSSSVTTAYLGAHLNNKDVMQVYEGFAAQGGEAQARARFNRWVTDQLAGPQSTAQAGSAPSNTAWTQLLSTSTSYTDSRGTTDYFAMTDYRLNDINSGGDWYLFATQFQTAPAYQGCSYSNVCGPFTTQRNMNIPGTSPRALSDYGPTGTITSSTAGWTVGGSLTAGTDVGAGVSASYSQSWDQPAVTTYDQSNYGSIFAGWQENFTGPDYGWWPISLNAPPGTSTGSFQSYQASIFRAPEGTSSFNQAANASSTTRLDFGWHSCNLIYVCWYESFITVNLGLGVPVHPPALSVSPSSLSLKPTTSGAFSIQALVPDSNQGLAWDITNIPSWLAVSQLSGSGAASVTVTVARKTPIGSVAYLNVNTSPAFAAPNVELGPIVFPVTVVKK